MTHSFPTLRSSDLGRSGALLPFSAEGAVRVVDAFTRLADETQDTAELDPSDRDALLGASGPMFTNMWLLDCLDKAMPGSAPDMVNADGDDLVFHRIVFPLAKGVVGKSLIRRLNAAKWLEHARDGFWNWLRTEERSEGKECVRRGKSRWE